MKASGSRQLSPFVARTLKTVGVIIILAALLDIFILPIPYLPLDIQWQIGFVTQVVDRGIVPLVGIALIIAASWIDSVTGATSTSNKSVATLRFWTLLLSCVLGLFYLLVFPLHLNNVRLNNSTAIERIGQEATQAEGQLETRLNAEVQQQQAQINQLLQASDEQLAQAEQAGVINSEQADLIRQFKSDPASLEPYIQQRVEQLRTQLQTQIGVRREQTLAAAKTEALKSGLRIGLSSLLLAIGYIIVGWTGLRAVGQIPSNRSAG